MALDVTSTGTGIAPREAGAVADAITVRVVTDKAEWDTLVAACPSPHLPQAFAYGEGKAAKGWQVERALFLSHGRPVAFATILKLRRLGVRLLNRINRGPLFLEEAPSDEEIVGVYHAIRNRWGRAWTAPLLIAPALPAGERSNTLLHRAGYLLRHRRSWRSGRISLRATEEALWKGFSSTFRNRVRNADKAGAELHVSDDDATFEWLLERHAENMAQKGFSAADATHLRAQRAAGPGEMLVFRLIHAGRPVAGMSVVSFGTHAEYHVGWFGADGRKLNAGNFLMWNVMREMKRRGIATFDVGGLKPGDGYTRFKQTMNPAEYELAGEWMSF